MNIKIFITTASLALSLALLPTFADARNNSQQPPHTRPEHNQRPPSEQKPPKKLTQAEKIEVLEELLKKHQQLSNGQKDEIRAIRTKVVAYIPNNYIEQFEKSFESDPMFTIRNGIFESRLKTLIKDMKSDLDKDENTITIKLF